MNEYNQDRIAKAQRLSDAAQREIADTRRELVDTIEAQFGQKVAHAANVMLTLDDLIYVTVNRMHSALGLSESLLAGTVPREAATRVIGIAKDANNDLVDGLFACMQMLGEVVGRDVAGLEPNTPQGAGLAKLMLAGSTRVRKARSAAIAKMHEGGQP